LAAPNEDAPFDPGYSWRLGAVRGPARALAVAVGALFAPAGVLVLAGLHTGAAPGLAGAALSLTLVLLTFHPWLLRAAAIDVAIAVVALT
jgi:hypothetical protein